jgi:hypothetical protein
LAQTATLVNTFVESNFEDNVQLLNSVPLAAKNPGVASVKLGPVPTFWEFDFAAKYYPNGLWTTKRILIDELEKSGFVIYGWVDRASGRNWIVHHKSKRQMSLFMLKHSELLIKVYDFYFNKKGNGRVYVQS